MHNGQVDCATYPIQKGPVLVQEAYGDYDPYISLLT